MMLWWGWEVQGCQQSSLPVTMARLPCLGTGIQSLDSSLGFGLQLLRAIHSHILGKELRPLLSPAQASYQALHSWGSCRNPRNQENKSEISEPTLAANARAEVGAASHNPSQLPAAR